MRLTADIGRFEMLVTYPDIQIDSLTVSNGASISKIAAPAPDQELSLNPVRPMSGSDWELSIEERLAACRT